MDRASARGGPKFSKFRRRGTALEREDVTVGRVQVPSQRQDHPEAPHGLAHHGARQRLRMPVLNPRLHDFYVLQAKVDAGLLQEARAAPPGLDQHYPPGRFKDGEDQARQAVAAAQIGYHRSPDKRGDRQRVGDEFSGEITCGLRASEVGVPIPVHYQRGIASKRGALGVG